MDSIHVGKGPIKATRKLDLSLVERLKEAGIMPTAAAPCMDAAEQPPTFRDDTVDDIPDKNMVERYFLVKKNQIIKSNPNHK